VFVACVLYGDETGVEQGIGLCNVELLGRLANLEIALLCDAVLRKEKGVTVVGFSVAVQDEQQNEKKKRRLTKKVVS